MYYKGFHGDEYLLKMIDVLIKRSKTFIETGANIGITLSYVARKYPKIMCYSCEPDKNFFKKASARTDAFEHVALFNEPSQNFLNRLELYKALLHSNPTLFWIDAHGHGFDWPLREEIKFITSNFKTGYLFIDDFRVPHNKKFQFNKYKKQHCSFEYIKNSINPSLDFNLYYPNYSEHTSKHHPLVGWGLIQFGDLTRLDKKFGNILRWVNT